MQEMDIILGDKPGTSCTHTISSMDVPVLETDSTGVQKETDSTRVQKETDSAGVQKETDSTGVQKEADSTRVQKETDSTRVQKETDSTGVQKETDSTRVQKETDSTRVQKETDSTGIQKETDSTGVQKEADSNQQGSIKTTETKKTIMLYPAWIPSLRKYQKDQKDLCKKEKKSTQTRSRHLMTLYKDTSRRRLIELQKRGCKRQILSRHTCFGTLPGSFL